MRYYIERHILRYYMERHILRGLGIITSDILLGGVIRSETNQVDIFPCFFINQKYGENSNKLRKYDIYDHMTRKKTV